MLAACTGSEPAADPTETRAATTSSAALEDAAAGDQPEETPADIPSFAGTDPAPEFPTGLDWINVDGELSLEQLRGRVVLLDFWTYGCINCIHIIPDLHRLEEEHPDELVVIGVHSAKFVNEGATENIRQVVLRYGVDHPVVNDRDFEIWRRWGVNAWPTTVLIDPAGNIVGGHAGEGVYDVVAPVVQALVNEFDRRGELDRSAIEFAPESIAQPRTLLSYPGKVEVAADDDRIFIADTGHHRIVTTDRSGNVLAVFGNGAAGFVDGPAEAARFDSPQGMSLDANGRVLYVADTNNHAIRAVDTTTGDVTTLAGTGAIGWPPTAGFVPDVGLNSPWDVLVDDDLVYVAMAGHHQIWVIDLGNGVAQPLVGNAREGVANGPLANAELAQPSGLALDGRGRLFFADSESSSIRSADLTSLDGETALVAGGSSSLFEFGDQDGVGDAARFQHPLGVVVWEGDGSLIVADTYNSRLRKVDPDTGETTTLFGTGQGWRDGAEPQFYEPGGLAIDGDTLFVADTNNHVVRMVDLATGTAGTLVLKGIEAFTPTPESADYLGTIIAAPAIVTAPGTVDIVLELGLPPGYKINDEAPSTIAIAGPVTADASVDITGATPPISLTADVTGSGDLMVDLNLVYCREDQQSLCLFEQVRFITPVETAADVSAATVRLTHDIAVPDLTAG